MTTKTKSRTTAELHEAALAGEQVDPAELASAQAAETLAELNAEGARRRAAEEAECRRQEGLALLAKDIRAFRTSGEETIAKAEAAIEAMATFKAAVVAHHDRVWEFARRARDLGVAEAGMGPVHPGPDGVTYRQELARRNGAEVALAEPDGSTRRLSAHEPSQAVFALLGELVARLDLPALSWQEFTAVRRQSPGETAARIRALDRLVPPPDLVKVVKRRNGGRRETVTMPRSHAEHGVKRGYFEWPASPTTPAA